MSSVAVLVPVLNRPQRAALLVESLRATSDALIVFLVSRTDRAERHAIHAVQDRHPFVEEVVVPFQPRHGDYARKINHGVSITSEEWVLQAADDLRFHPGWFTLAIEAHEQTGHRVLGTNDLCNPRVISGRHSTHSIVHRTYIEEIGTVDEPGKLLHEGYFHNFCDDELVAIAQVNREFRAVKRSIVQHLHPNCGTAEMDRTYERGLDKGQFAADRQIFQRRRARVFGRPVAGRRAR